MSEFSLDDLIRETIESTGLADPCEVAAVVAIPQEYQEQALQHVLPGYVGDLMRQLRRTAFAGEGVCVAGEKSTSGGRVGRSRWAKFTPELLNSSVSVAGERKLLGDCTVKDLEVIAGEYELRAEQNAAYAVRFKDLAKRLRRSGAVTLREAAAAGPVQIEAAAA